MTINVNPFSLKSELDKASPQFLADACRILKIGSVVRAARTTLRNKVPAASTVQLATLQSLVMADDAKASTIARAYARTGTGTAGELTTVAYGVTPAAGQIAVAPNGDIVTLAADAWTNLDVVYHPEKYDIAELILPVTANVLTLPAAVTTPGVVMLLETEALVGTVLGLKIVLIPGAGAPATGQARLNIAKTTVTFAGADAVTNARVKIAISSATDVDVLLTAASIVG